jgi:hypothetical protein
VRRTSVPKPLQEVLGDEGTAAFVDVFNRQQDQMTDDIARAVMRALGPRFASIESRLDQCATKADLADFATKADMSEFATTAAVERLAEKQEGLRTDLRNFATPAAVDRLAEKLDGVRAELRGFATQAAVDRLYERQEAFAGALERGFGGLRAEMANQRADMMKWMFLFWVGQAFVVLAYLRAAQ